MKKTADRVDEVADRIREGREDPQVLLRDAAFIMGIASQRIRRTTKYIDTLEKKLARMERKLAKSVSSGPS